MNFTTHKKIKEAPRGFIALISSIIISAVLLGAAITTGASALLSRADALNGEYKRLSLALAESCVNVALLRVAQDYNYTPALGGDIVSIGKDDQNRDETCIISSIDWKPSKDPNKAQNTAVIHTAAQYPLINGAWSSVAITSAIQNPAFAVPPRATIVVQTHVDNGDGGSKQAGDFLMSVPVGGNATPSDFAGSESGVTVYVDPGSYSIAGSSNSTYTKTSSSGCSGSLAAGQVASCIFTYDDIPTTAMLTVTAIIKNDNGGSLLPSSFPLFLDGASVVSGVPTTGLLPGTHTASVPPVPPAGYTASLWGTDCGSSGSITLAAGNKKTCTIIYDDIPPPAPSCADTAIMFDRTGSMQPSDLSNERFALSTLLGSSLYGKLTPHPLVAAGVFGDGSDDDGFAPAKIVAGLTTDYSSITGTMNTWLGNSSGYTNLESALGVAQTELTNLNDGKRKVLLLISDGEANRANSVSVTGASAWTSPSANAQNGTGDAWTNPSGAYSGGTPASDTGSHKHQYYNFGSIFSGLGIPQFAQITGIEVRADASATTGPVPGNIQGAAGSVGALTQWTNGNRAFLSDDQYATDSVNGHSESYGNFSVAVPAGATITGIQIFTEGKITGSGSLTTPVLFSSGQGNYTSWNGSEADTDETGTPDCSSGDRIDSNNSNNRESVQISLSGVPDGSTITSVQVLTWDQSSGSTGGGYQTFARMNGTDTSSGTTITTTSTSGCTARTQNIDLPDTVKNGSTNLEVGVLKVGNTTARVGAIRATVTYIPATTGSVAVSLSSNGGGAWTSAKTVSLGGIEASSSPSGNSSSDLWGRPWIASDFNNGNFMVRIQNTSVSGNVSLDQVSARVFYTALPSAGNCVLGVDVSRGGNTFTSTGVLATTTLTGTKTTYTFGSQTDRWGGSWLPGDFSSSLFANSDFRLRISDTGCGGSSASVSNLQIRVSYMDEATSRAAALAKATAAKNAGTEIFAVRYSSDNDANGISFLQNAASPDTFVGNISAAPNGAKRVSNVVTITTAANHGIVIGQSVKISGVADSGFNGTFVVTSVPTANTFTYAQSGTNKTSGGGLVQYPHYFVSPTNASQMAAVFNTIGVIVCPAINAPPASPPPVHGTLLVITHLINDNGGTSGASAFPITVNGLNPTPGTFPMPGTDAPGTAITLDPGSFSVSEDISGLPYSQNLGAGCTGTIHAGDVLTCTITNDDLPPPPSATGAPPQPPASITIGSWQEVP